MMKLIVTRQGYGSLLLIIKKSNQEGRFKAITNVNKPNVSMVN